jgi:hypothetical protein
MSAIGSFALGIMIGTALGFFAAGLCHVASDMEDGDAAGEPDKRGPPRS